MQLRYDSDADVIFLTLREPDGGEGGGRRIDETRIAHVDREGNVFAYEFLDVSTGVSLGGIGPDDAERIRAALRPVGRIAAV